MVESMRILAIDASGGAVSACVTAREAVEPLARESMTMQRGHAEALAPMIERVMRGVEGGFSSIGRIAATVGPGSFTGIRIGLASARAMGVALGVPVIGVSSLVAYVGELLLEPGAGVIASAIDARHGRVYLQVFEASGRPLIPARLATIREAARIIGAGPARLAGDGAHLVRAEAALLGVAAEIVGETVAPDIAIVARLGLIGDPTQSPPRPFYLKAPDAIQPMDSSIARAET